MLNSFFLSLKIATVYTTTVLSTHLSSCEALTIHFETFRFLAAALKYLHFRGKVINGGTIFRTHLLVLFILLTHRISELRVHLQVLFSLFSYLFNHPLVDSEQVLILTFLVLLVLEQSHWGLSGVCSTALQSGWKEWQLFLLLLSESSFLFTIFATVFTVIFNQFMLQSAESGSRQVVRIFYIFLIDFILLLLIIINLKSIGKKFMKFLFLDVYSLHCFQVDLFLLEHNSGRG